jgi:ligand-binding sensor domain-containing protein
MKTSLQPFSKLEVKATLEVGEFIWLGTAAGLYRVEGRTARPIDSWRGREVRALGPAAGGFWVVAGSHPEQTIHRCDLAGSARAEIAPPPGENITAIGSKVCLWVGTKRGIFRHTEQGWQQVFKPDRGKAEIIWLAEYDDRIAAGVKKQGDGDRPALAESYDGGATWHLTVMDDYGDIVLAANADLLISRWKGARRRDMQTGYKMHPLSAAHITPGRYAVIDGSKLEIHYGPRVRVTAHHPLLGDAEHVHPRDNFVLFAGPQGAYAFDVARGLITDLLPDQDFGTPSGKTKRLYLLDAGAWLATTTFGTFRSVDQGLSWQVSDSEWTVLDAEAIDRDRQGVWWLGCQRGVFFSCDNGESWSYLKLKTSPHHYAELRSLVVAEDRLCLATKAGLFVSKPGQHRRPGHVDAFGRESIEGLLYDSQAHLLLVGTASGRLCTYDPESAETRELATLPLHESRFAGTAAALCVATEHEIYEVAAGQVRAVTPSGVRGGLHMAATAERIVVWDAHTGWSRGAGGAEWMVLADWPKGIRHASVAPDGSFIIATDRQYIYHIAM